MVEWAVIVKSCRVPWDRGRATILPSSIHSATNPRVLVCCDVGTLCDFVKAADGRSCWIAIRRAVHRDLPFSAFAFAILFTRSESGWIAAALTGWAVIGTLWWYVLGSAIDARWFGRGRTWTTV